MGAGLLVRSAPTITNHTRRVLEFEFESVHSNLQDTILIPIGVGRDTPLEEMDIADFGFVRHSDLFPLRYAGLQPMRFLQRWEDDTMYFENWFHGDGTERISMDDIYTILAEIDEVMGRASMTREEHAQAMGNMVKIRDFVAFVADQERGVEGDETAKDAISAGKEDVGIANK